MKKAPRPPAAWSGPRRVRAPTYVLVKLSANPGSQGELLQCEKSLVPSAITTTSGAYPEAAKLYGACSNDQH